MDFFNPALHQIFFFFLYSSLIFDMKLTSTYTLVQTHQFVLRCKSYIRKIINFAKPVVNKKKTNIWSLAVSSIDYIASLRFRFRHIDQKTFLSKQLIMFSKHANSSWKDILRIKRTICNISWYHFYIRRNTPLSLYQSIKIFFFPRKMT